MESKDIFYILYDGHKQECSLNLSWDSTAELEPLYDFHCDPTCTIKKEYDAR